MTTTEKCPGGASSSCTLETIAAMRPVPEAAFERTTATMSGSWSTAHTEANEERSANASCPVPQARSSSRPAPDAPVRRTRSAISASGYESLNRS